MYTINRPDELPPERLESITVYERDDIDVKLTTSTKFYIETHRAEMIERRNKLDMIPVPATFDIETTTIQAGTLLNTSDQDFAFTYSYQIYLFGYCWILRDETAFVYFMDKLAELLRSYNLSLIWYIHNASFEYMFIKKLIPIDFETLFALQTRRIGKFYAYDSHMEFRCSYLLSNMSLEKFAENYCPPAYRKDKDLIDYEILRFPWTVLTNEELYYNAMDVICLYHAVMSIMQKEADTLKTIPLTNTGYVRRACRNACLGDNTKRYRTPEEKKTYRKYFKYRDMFQKCATDLELYRLMELSFRGGNTHANRFIAGRLLEESKGLKVESWDFSSSYPAICICSDDFPMGKIMECTNSVQTIADFEYYCKKYWVLCEVAFEDLELRDPYHTPCPYIPIAKISRDHEKMGIYDNGRIIKQPGVCRFAFLGLEWELIKKQYKGKMKVLRAYYAPKGYLPLAFRQEIYNWFNEKTTLKGVAGKEYEYMRAKNRLNAGSYGMMVEKIIKEIIYTEDEIIKSRKPTEEEAQAQIDSFYNPINKKFVLYQWGITIPAVARIRHMEMVDIAGDDFVYGDTDSVKLINGDLHRPAIEAYNETWKKYIAQCGCGYESYTKDGEYQCLGIADYEGSYLEFITLGAKKYADTAIKKSKLPITTRSGKKLTIRNKYKHLEITVAGVPKKIGAKLLGDIRNFHDDFTFYVGDEGNVKDRQDWKKLLTYREDTDFWLDVGENRVHVTTGIAISRTSYKMSLTPEYIDITGYNGEVMELDDIWY